MLTRLLAMFYVSTKQKENCQAGLHVWGRWKKGFIFQHHDCNICGFRQETLINGKDRI